VRALLVDGAGTLLNLAEPTWRVYARIAEAHGLAVSPGLAARIAGAMAERRPPPLEDVPLEAVPALEREGWREIVRLSLGDEAVEGPVFEALLEHYAMPGAWCVEPGAPEALDRVRAHGISCALVTNMDARLSGILRGLDLERRFDAVASPSTVGRTKPDPRIFLETLKRVGAEPAHAIYIGDRETDCLDAARRAGLKTIRYDPTGDPSRTDVLVDWSVLPARVGVENA
jgi:HAD superfamily hydrolase (TIGR01509 family)